MSSIFEGYNYDIFISYRQKDNKGDRWVSTFVEALKTELEATFKEDVSVYFDENPHDRLQETHNVDKSLEGKLKCLIFIPILSQTYCDPNSYAWQYEFLAFNKLAKEDRFGRDIRLRGGNYASRILPIRIHDLEQEDVKLFEKETGSVLRAMDFVFRTASGVNRALKLNEDHPQDNLNKTFYSDQINKVAHAIKEIIQGMKPEPVRIVKEKNIQEAPTEDFLKVYKEEEYLVPSKVQWKKLLTGGIVLAVLAVIFAILAYPKIFKHNKVDDLRSSDGRISIAVIPFQNMTNDTTWNVWQEGIQDILVTYLTNSPKELKVRQTESINNLIRSKGLVNYASMTPAVAGAISQKLDADVFIFGSIKQAGSTVRLNAQLIDSKTEEVFRSFEIDGPAREDMIFRMTDSLKNLVKNSLIISKLSKEMPGGTKHYEYTKSPEAFRYFIYGNKAFANRDYPTARNWYLQALASDSNLINAAIYLSSTYSNQGLYEDAKKWCMQLYEKRNSMPLYYKIMTDRLHASYFETPNEEIKYLKQLLEIDDQQPIVYYILGITYNHLYQYDKAITELEKALEIHNKWGSKPVWVYNYVSLGDAYHKTGQYKKEKNLFVKAEQDFPGDYALLRSQAILSLTEGDEVTANRYIDKYISVRKENSVAEAAIMAGVADIYSEAGVPDKAEEYYRHALSSEPENPLLLNNFAWFLIENDRNINESMDLIGKALELSPDTDYMLDTKGWGLYKQGKYREALKVLQKADSLKPVYDHEMYLHLEEVKKAVDSQK